jgi:protein gp37
MKRFGKDHSQVVKANDATFYAPLKWKEPARVFCCPWSDFWIEEADGSWRWRALQVIAQTPHLTYIIPTKRPERIIKVLYEDGALNWPGVGNLILPNVWHLVSVENQEATDKRVSELLRLREYGNWPVLGVSIEPQIERISIAGYLYKCPECGERPVGGNIMTLSAKWRFNGKRWEHYHGYPVGHIETVVDTQLDAVICGCESGKNRRPFNENWARLLRDECQAAGVPFYFKQSIQGGKLVKEPFLDGVQHLSLPWVQPGDLEEIG